MHTGVLISGGVDSSVALCELKKLASSKLTAFYLKIWLEDELSFLGSCPWEQDLKYVREICETLKVPLEVIPLQRQYHEKVVAYTVAELKAGKTPSPDLLCNQYIKYGAFLDLMEDRCDKVASGHYADIENINGTYVLRQAADPIKDQTYFLSQLRQHQLARALFPLGRYTKAQVRELAKAYALPNAERPDSQGICFLGKIKFNEFVKYHLGEKPGPIVELGTGKKLGEHRGYWFHTVGQRRGLGLSGGPWFVCGKDVEQNTIFVRHSKSEIQQNFEKFLVRSINWIRPPQSQDLRVKVRHGVKTYQCSLSPCKDRVATVSMEEADSGIASGQFAVFYEEDYCIGSGVIELMH